METNTMIAVSAQAGDACAREHCGGFLVVVHELGLLGGDILQCYRCERVPGEHRPPTDAEREAVEDKATRYSESRAANISPPRGDDRRRSRAVRRIDDEERAERERAGDLVRALMHAGASLEDAPLPPSQRHEREAARAELAQHDAVRARREPVRA